MMWYDPIMKRFDLQQSLRYWQKVLRLQDWEITATWTVFEDDDDHGSNMVRSEFKDSTVKVNGKLKADDHMAEVTLVHELLHIPMDFVDFKHPMKRGSLRHMLLEQAIDVLAKAFVDVRRR